MSGLEHINVNTECTCGGAGYCSACVGLVICGVCGGAEGELTTECPGRRTTELERYMIYELSMLDFINGQWVINELGD